MYSLFIDSTSGLVIGLLDSKFSWVEYIALDEKKHSEIIHAEIFNLLQRHKLQFSQIRCFVASGPGSYTGMRLSEGLAQVFELSNVPVFSFYHFDVPRLTGTANGFWATNAFKGQVFVYNWIDQQLEKHLVNKEDFFIQDSSLGFTLDAIDPLFQSLPTTKNLVKERASSLFPIIVDQKLRVPPYYFRTLDEEFR